MFKQKLELYLKYGTIIKCLACVSCSFLCVFLGLYFVWKYSPHSFSIFNLSNMIPQFLYCDEEQRAS